MSSPSHNPGYSALRKGRLDVKEALYFLTITIQRPLLRNSVGLTQSDLLASLINRAQSINEWELLSMVVMPDHLHALTRLKADKIAIPVRKLKGGFLPVLRNQGIKWQPGFYDHRLRPEDNVGGVLRYMWLNPYRAGLSREGDPWSGWYCSEAAAQWMGSGDIDSPPPEWWQ